MSLLLALHFIRRSAASYLLLRQKLSWRCDTRLIARLGEREEDKSALRAARRVGLVAPNTGEAIMSKAVTKEDRAILKNASEMFDETGCVPGIDGEEVPAERIVPDVKEYISETIDDPEALYDPEIWDTPGFTLVLSWLAQKRASKMPKARTSRQ